MSMIENTRITKIRLNEKKSDYAYWLTQSNEARINALEAIRKEYNDWKYHDRQRFQRIYRVIKQK